MRQFLNEPGHFFISDHLVALVYIVILLIWANFKHQKLNRKEPLKENSYYLKGFIAKILLSYGFALIYFFLYNGGDSAAYFQNALIMNRLLLENPYGYFDLMISPNISWEDYFLYFTNTTQYPQMSISLKDNNHIVVKFATLIAPLGAYNFFATSILFGAICYQFVFKAYKTFCKITPNSEYTFAIAFLFFPSFLFWSGGIMKDTICVAAIAYIIYAFYKIFILKERSIFVLTGFVFSTYLLLTTKPYLLFALIPGIVFWAAFEFRNSLQNKIIKIGLIPFVLLIAGIGTTFLLNNAISSSFGSSEQALETAVITQQDLIRSEQYGSNYYDIGKYEASPIGILKKAPEAIVVGLYMPFLWQATNPVTLISALENLILLLMTIYFLFKTRIYGLFSQTFKNPVLLFCISFSIITAFIVGITTANFGALVRYKVQLIPYFISYFVIIINNMNARKNNANNVEKETN